MSELVWNRPKRCDTGSCILVAFDRDKVYVADSKNPDGGRIEYTRNEWEDLLGQVHSSRGAPADAWQPFSNDDWCWGREDHDPDEWLRFTPAEMDAFVAGVRNHEFGVDAALTLMAGKDPRRAQRLFDDLKAAVRIAEELDRAG